MRSKFNLDLKPQKINCIKFQVMTISDFEEKFKIDR